LRKVFTDPQALKPRQSTKDITEEIAREFGKLSEGMRERGIPPGRAAHFLMKLMFCMFAEGVGLVDGKPFTKILASSRFDPKALARKMGTLFGTGSLRFALPGGIHARRVPPKGFGNAQYIGSLSPKLSWRNPRSLPSGGCEESKETHGKWPIAPRS
jgi:hypothetical protein